MLFILQLFTEIIRFLNLVLTVDVQTLQIIASLVIAPFVAIFAVFLTRWFTENDLKKRSIDGLISEIKFNIDHAEALEIAIDDILSKKVENNKTLILNIEKFQHFAFNNCLINGLIYRLPKKIYESIIQFEYYLQDLDGGIRLDRDFHFFVTKDRNLSWETRENNFNIMRDRIKDLKILYNSELKQLVEDNMSK